MNDEVKGFHSGVPQGREDKESTFKPLSELNEYQDDIAAVSLAYHLPSLSYIDFSGQSAISSAFSRWPLLAELSQKQENK
ncbi:cellulose biosynthesis protein BcsR [Budvicia diplopodorum]|uniref:cellulose biosynthesis protein BcsR n=1 Tax=Budvicia diplopodorum TaxID=1119056 RepID=UPI00135B6624|nr:cellulose biosynthesis protein BcsR [Budvicia diplopodorum]